MKRVKLFKDNEIAPKETASCFVCGEPIESYNPKLNIEPTLLINYKPVCSWKCFLKYVIEHTKKKEDTQNEKPKRGRPRKHE